jgi:hypothetical protein
MPRPDVLDLQVAELRQLFNAMDPAPFRERDLDPNAEEYIVGWAREAPPRVPLGLVVRLSRDEPMGEWQDLLRDAVHAYFRDRAAATRRQLRRLFRHGRISLVIGLAFLAVAILAGEALASLAKSESYAGIVKESFVIGGWVALWRPIEIFLFDWWPMLGDARLYDRLGAMRVELATAPAAGEAR